jgi:type I restriction enzyme S subunit
MNGFLEELLNGQKVEWKKLGSVCEVLRGSRLTKKELSDEYQYPVFHGGLIPLGRYHQYNRKANKTMIINTGSIGEVVWSGVDFWSSDGTFTIETPEYINDRFLYFFLKINEDYFKSQKREGGVPTINRLAIESLQIPIPPLAVQQEIVEILDTLTTHTAALQKEITLRQKQYEYYRNQLLNFEK